MKSPNPTKLSPGSAMIIFVCVIIIFTISILYIAQQPVAQNTESPPPQSPSAPSSSQSDSPPKQEKPAAPSLTKYSDSTYGIVFDFGAPYSMNKKQISSGYILEFKISDIEISAELTSKKDAEAAYREKLNIGQEDEVLIDAKPAIRIIGTTVTGELTYLYVIEHQESAIIISSHSAEVQEIIKKITLLSS